MKKITLLLILFWISHLSFSQCINGIEFPVLPTASDNSGEEQEITDQIETDEFATVNTIIPGDSYKFTVTHTSIHDYLTITDESNTVIVHGSSPLTTSAIAVNTIRIHVSVDAICTTDAFFHTATIQNLSKVTCNKPNDPGIDYLSDARIDFFGVHPN